MADKSINQLPVSDGLTDDGLLVVYQDSATKSITGSLFKQFAQQGIESAMAAAKESGEFDGADGQDGQDGNDGVSPTITVTDITGGHRLTITDVNGTQTVDVLDGKDGEDGADGTSTGGTGSGDMLASVYDPQGKAQDVFAYADNKFELAAALTSMAYVVYVDLTSNTADTAIDLILDEINADRSIYARIEDGDVSYKLFPLVSCVGSSFIDGVSTPAQAKFSAVMADGTARVITLTEGDDIVHPDVTVTDYALTMPTVTADDDGKILQVVGGQWTAVAITDGNNVAY